MRLYPAVCVCRTPKVAPATSLQISSGALLKLQSAQSRCGFQAFTHAEKLQLIYTLPILAHPFCALNLSLFFSVAFLYPAELIFSCFFLIWLTWNFRLATKYCILRRTFTADLWAWDNLWQKGARVKLWEGKKKQVYLLYVLCMLTFLHQLHISCASRRGFNGEKVWMCSEMEQIREENQVWHY